MKSKILKLAVVSIVLSWMAVSFFALSLNPVVWGEGGRYIFILLSLAVGWMYHIIDREYE